MADILILGAGLVAKPIINDLLKKGHYLTVTSLAEAEAKTLTGNHPHAATLAWTVEQLDVLDRLVSKHDLIISLIPWIHHLIVAECCLKNRKNLLTTSYVKPKMAALDTAVKEAGLLFLNECGLDPGLDHMSAMRIIDHVHGRGGKIKEFYSLCGALPAPESNDNLFGYKFSWSPKGVVLASSSDAQYKRHNQIVNISTEDLFKDRFEIHDFPEIGTLEAYPNRDSLSYLDIYNIQEAESIMRGTLRFPHWCEILDVMKNCNLITQENFDFTGKSFIEMTAMMCKQPVDNIREFIAKKNNITIDSAAIRGMEWLGLFSTDKMNRQTDSPFEVVADLMITKMSLKINEKDLNVMLHIFSVEYPDGKQEIIKSKLVDYGSPATETAIARNVTLPASVAAQLMLDGTFKLKGVYRPTLPEFYNPILDGLEKYGIKMEEIYGLPMKDMIHP
jgi:saccharopine dehydrogenase-like NADP-dependent oxidoreductase